jgi:lantibiotic transport system ATP-binding protein
MNCIEIKGLTHHFSKDNIVLDGININVKEGSIYGFLGPNGAGKTTTLRLILGLLRQQEGDIRVFGQSLVEKRTEILRGVGSLIESPSLYGQLSAIENLKVWQTVYRCPKSRIQEVLDLVGLGKTGTKKASQFSLGMKQRLAIAIALLHNPKLLILDEPTNGLDPNGIVEMRELLKKLNHEQGITIMVSSHLLLEIEKLVTDVGIIHKGKMLFEGNLADLKQRQNELAQVVFEVNNCEKAIPILKQHNIAAACENDKIILQAPSKNTIAQVNKHFVHEGIAVYGISTIRQDLEAIFMEITHS